MKKKIIGIIFGLFALVNLGACSKKEDMSAFQNTKTTTKPTTQESTKKSSSKISNSTTRESHKESSVTSSENTTTVKKAPNPPEESATSHVNSLYSVDLSQYQSPLTFYYRGVNVPDSVTINDSTSSSVTFVFGNYTSSSYKADKAEIPTKEIRVFSASNNSIRTVKVNTQINLTGKLSNDNRDMRGPLYLFHNNQGGISLVTPNYAGNVGPDQRDVMLEVVQ